ncbi:MAG: TIM barrel protein [Atribacterales bacterium]
MPLEENLKLSVGIWCMGGVADRFLPQGYEEPVSIQERIKRVKEVPEVEAIEFFDDELEKISPQDFKSLLDDQGLKVSCINLNTHSHPKWQLGALTHRDPKLRREAIDAAKKVIDLTDLFQCNSVGLWLGVDGFDYPFQVDYGVEWDLLLESLEEIADYGSQVKIALEYKLKEPRQYLLVGNAFRALYLIKTLNRKNLGVTVDFGHALMAKENPGEVVSILSREKVLYNVHFNDAYREWDDDLIAGSTNLYETLEFLYYIEKSGYQGYLGFDIFPYRIHPVRALQLCARNTLDLYRLLKSLERDALHKAQEKMDAAQAHELARKVFFK